MLVVKRNFRKIIFIFCIVCWGIFVHTDIALSETSAEEDRGNLLSRIDFGNAYVMGQTIKSGAVYLMQRKQSDIESMLKYREHYREEILENFVGKESDKDINKQKVK